MAESQVELEPKEALEGSVAVRTEIENSVVPASLVNGESNWVHENPATLAAALSTGILQ